MVKKLLANGDACAKCGQAEEMLKKRGVWERIDEVVWAKETDPNSEGMRLAAEHNVSLAPFFLVFAETGSPEVFTSTMKVVRLLNGSAAKKSPASATSPFENLSSEQVISEEEALRNESPEEILKWGLKRFGQGCGLAFSGAEDVVLIDMAHRSGLEFSVFCLDTGRLPAATYRFVEQVRTHYNLNIELVSPQALPLQQFVRTKGLFSFYEDGHGQCCSVRKIEPLRRVLGTLDAWVTGQRRDQSPSTRGEVKVLELDGAFEGRGSQLLKLNPLAHWSSAEVWQYIRERQIPYNELHDEGFVSIGCEPCTRALRPGEHERAARWWWEETTQRECGLHMAPGPKS